MSDSLDRAHRSVLDLVENYDKHRSAFLDLHYSEARVRQDFIDKFLTALGWDVAHNEQTNPYEQEVKVEPNVNELGKAQRRADYSFSLAPDYSVVRFYVEAKKPSAELATQDNYFQTVRYGWNSQTPISILTSFDQLHVLGRVFCGGIDANAEQVRRGMAWVFDRYVKDRSLYPLQDEAKAARRGLWADKAPVAPWEWRKTRGSMSRKRLQ